MTDFVARTSSINEVLGTRDGAIHQGVHINLSLLLFDMVRRKHLQYRQFRSGALKSLQIAHTSIFYYSKSVHVDTFK